VKTPEVKMAAQKLRIALAGEVDRPFIYRLRHEVYACELHQHPENPAGQLSDALDAFNSYIVAFASDGRRIGFISITPPDHTYSLERYIARSDLPFPVDAGLYEVRLLAVERACRGSLAAPVLLYASLRWVESQCGTRIMAIGRSEVVSMYGKLGFELHHRQVHSGAVAFELMSVPLDHVSGILLHYEPMLQKLETAVDWQLDVPFRRALRQVEP
jgi:acetyltransferase (GNAT) family protein